MSININYLRHLPLGLVEFLLFHIALDWGRKIYNFFSWTNNSCNIKYSKLDHLSNNQKVIGETTKNQDDLDIINSNDGSLLYVRREEIENIVLKSLGIFGQHEVLKLEERFDCDDLVKIFEENNPSLDEVKQAFDVFDDNEDGFIDANELQRVLFALGLREGFGLENCIRMISVYDENKDGRIDFAEFVKFIESINF